MHCLCIQYFPAIFQSQSEAQRSAPRGVCYGGIARGECLKKSIFVPKLTGLQNDKHWHSSAQLRERGRDMCGIAESLQVVAAQDIAYLHTHTHGHSLPGATNEKCYFKANWSPQLAHGQHLRHMGQIGLPLLLCGLAACCQSFYTFWLHSAHTHSCRMQNEIAIERVSKGTGTKICPPF